jgi:hypothetical protein
MTNKYKSSWLALVVATLPVALALAPAATAAAAEPCERGCMRKILDQYLNAVFAHDPSKAPLAKNARATENAAEVAKGDGAWKTMTGFGSVQRRYFDTSSGQAVFYGTLIEGNEPDIISLRLKIVDKRVTEAEWTIARKEYGGMFAPSELAAMPPPPDTPISEDQRTSRADLIAAADAYFDGLKLHDGSKVPHIEGCERIENGVKVTNRDRTQAMPPIPGGAPATPGAPPAGAPNMAQEARSGDCVSGFEGFAKTIADTTHRRYVVDEQAGVVLGATLFHRPPGVTLRRNLLSEFFWEKRGKISAIYAAMYYLDPSAPDTPGW